MYCVLLMFYLVCFERHEVVVSSLLLYVVFLALLKISWRAHLTTVLHNKYTAVGVCVVCEGVGGKEREGERGGGRRERAGGREGRGEREQGTKK